MKLPPITDCNLAMGTQRAVVSSLLNLFSDNSFQLILVSAGVLETPVFLFTMSIFRRGGKDKYEKRYYH